jgi:hypothetical protein
MSQFKPGDLAIIVRAFSDCSENIGRVVEVVEVDSPAIDDYPIHVSAPGLIGRDQFTGDAEPTSDCWCSAKCLMPLKGDFVPEQQKSREVAA